jgi:hypothetical protein
MAYQIDYEITSQKLGIKAENRKRGGVAGDFAMLLKRSNPTPPVSRDTF